MYIFQNINSKGKPLDLFDLIKNRLFLYCEENTINREQNNLVVAFNTVFEYRERNKNTNFFISLIRYFLGKEINVENKTIVLESFEQIFEKYF
jgi:uncharacterized protein with ParB-like and HNH nuclease domain